MRCKSPLPTLTYSVPVQRSEGGGLGDEGLGLSLVLERELLERELALELLQLAVIS